MRRPLFGFQIFLLVTAFLLAVQGVFGQDYSLLVLWQLFTGCAQLICAIGVTIKYRRIPLIRKLIGLYWMGVATDFLLLLFFGNALPRNEFLMRILLFIIPWGIALYFTIVTYKLRVHTE